MKSVLIIGLGQFGVHMAEKLMENDNEVMLSRAMRRELMLAPRLYLES